MHKVIFDTDPGVDDAMALLFLHHHPEIDLIGITTVFGNASVETTTRNALFLKQAWDISAPIAKGEGKTYDPMRNPVDWPVMVHGENGLGNVAVPEETGLPLDPRPAHRFIIETVRANPGEIVVVAVGRMSNLAYALKEDPDIAGLVKEVVIMGGAFDVPGNITPAAEANIHGDPEAADVVMTAPWKVVVVGLDVTMKTVMTRPMLAELVETGSERVRLLSDISQFYIDFYGKHVDNGMVVHDSCACAYLVAPELFTTRGGAIRVVCGGIADGQTIQKPDGRYFPPGNWDEIPSQLACIDIDAPAVLGLICGTLARRP
ncbi:MAG: nucleoside hydrolase [Shinella sp.]|nr:nucleoside hydrolase [Shinella sp.]